MGNGASLDIVQEVDASFLYQRWLDEPVSLYICNNKLSIPRRNLPSSWTVEFKGEKVLVENLNDYINFILLRSD